MPEQIRKESPTPLHKQGKIPVWEKLPKPEIDDVVSKIDKASKKRKEPERSPCGCW